ncbi:MAG: hypothetical protein AABY75_08805, partial [Bacteroidota bacterium]
MKFWWIKKAAAFIALAAVVTLALGGIVLLLWNAIVPDVFGAPTLTYWHAVGIMLLTQNLNPGIG